MNLNITSLVVLCFLLVTAKHVYAEVDQLLDSFPEKTWTDTSPKSRGGKSVSGKISMKLHKAKDKETYTLRINVPPNVDQAIARDDSGTLIEGRALLLELSKPGTITLGVEDDKAYISFGELYYKETNKLGKQPEENDTESRKPGFTYTPAVVTTVDWLPWLDTNKEKALVEFVLGYFGGNIWSYFSLGYALSEITETKAWAMTTGIPYGFHAKPGGEYKESDYGKEAFYGPDDERRWDFHTAAWQRLSNSWKSHFGTWGYQINYTFYATREKPDKTPLYVRVLLPITRLDSYKVGKTSLPYKPLIKYIELEWLTELPGKEPDQSSADKISDILPSDFEKKSAAIIETAIKVTDCKTYPYTNLNRLSINISDYNAGKIQGSDFMGSAATAHNPGASYILFHCAVNNTGNETVVFHAKTLLENQEGGIHQCGIAHNITLAGNQKKNIIILCHPKYAPSYKARVVLFNKKSANLAGWRESGDKTITVYPLGMHCSTGQIYDIDKDIELATIGVHNNSDKDIKAKFSYKTIDPTGKEYPLKSGIWTTDSSGKNIIKHVDSATIKSGATLYTPVKFKLPGNASNGKYSIHGKAYDCTDGCSTNKVGYCKESYAFCVCKHRGKIGDDVWQKSSRECDRICNPQNY